MNRESALAKPRHWSKGLATLRCSGSFFQQRVLEHALQEANEWSGRHSLQRSIRGIGCRFPDNLRHRPIGARSRDILARSRLLDWWLFSI
jgi:hypothetical protein